MESIILESKFQIIFIIYLFIHSPGRIWVILYPKDYCSYTKKEASRNTPILNTVHRICGYWILNR